MQIIIIYITTNVPATLPMVGGLDDNYMYLMVIILCRGCQSVPGCLETGPVNVYIDGKLFLTNR